MAEIPQVELNSANLFLQQQRDYVFTF